MFGHSGTMKDRGVFSRYRVLVVLPVLLAAAPAYAQTATGQAAADISDSLTLSQVDGLDFGTILPGAGTGRVNINRNNGNCSTVGSITLVGGCHRGEFAVTGVANAQVRITTDSAPITLTRQGGGATMTMDRLRINGGRNKSLSGAGTLTFYTSGRLQVGANQAPGVYDATFNVTVEYR